MWIKRARIEQIENDIRRIENRVVNLARDAGDLRSKTRIIKRDDDGYYSSHVDVSDSIKMLFDYLGLELYETPPSEMKIRKKK